MILRYRTLAALLLLGLSGCAGMGMPTLAPEGSLARQRAVAQRFDPFPEEGPGPHISEGRPLGFEHALPETRRARWNAPPGFQQGW